jgi:hypothetical protein
VLAAIARVVGRRVPYPEQNLAGLALPARCQVLQSKAGASGGWCGGEVGFVDTAKVRA